MNIMTIIIDTNVKLTGYKGIQQQKEENNVQLLHQNKLKETLGSLF